MTKEKLVILGHPNPDIDSIISGILMEHYINNYTNYQGEFIIPDTSLDKSTIDICKKYNIDYQSHQKEIPKEVEKLVLVDHNITTYKDKKVIAVIDHHPSIKVTPCKFYQNNEISSTAIGIVRDRETYFTKEQLKLAILATLVDTASFNSTKGRQEDKVWVDDMIKIFDFDKDDLYKTGLHLTNLENLKEAAFELLKRYDIAGKKVEASVIQIIPDKNQKEIQRMKEIIIDYFFANDLDIYLFIVHDMQQMKTNVYKIFRDCIKIDEYNQYTSRGNVIIPNLEKQINDGAILSSIRK